MISHPKIALVYDRVNKFGGAERVLSALHELYPQAPLYTSVYNPKTAPWASSIDVQSSFLQSFPFARTNHEYYLPLMPYAFESFDFSSFDIVVSITSSEAKGVITKPNQLHLCYLLTPTRYLWSHNRQYVDSAGSAVSRSLRHILFSKIRRWDYIAAHRPDKIIAISNYVARRAKKYYRRDCEQIIYPPVDHNYFSKPEINSYEPIKMNNDYYLLVSRLVDYKSADICVEAFNKLPQEKLLIVGEGRSKKRLMKMAPDNVEFMGFVDDEALRQLYFGAKALIFPQEEDFGITPLEAMASGKPVIAFRKGGACETIVDGVTGIFFDKQSSNDIVSSLSAFNKINWYSDKISSHAKKFDTEVFKTNFRNSLEDLWQKHQKLT